MQADATLSVLDNRYQLIKTLGTGGMGTVHQARDLQTGQLVAIKSLKPEVVAEEPEMLSRFEREAEALRRLNHPNIVKRLAMLHTAGQHYLVMEYVEGGSLAQLLKTRHKLPITRVVQIGLDLADALTRAHRLNIIHRDIKPSNILLGSDDIPRLTDFGIAHMDDADLTHTGVLIGTCAYLCPEVLNGQIPDARTDIWAFGVTLFEMLTGKRPYQEETISALLTSILTKPVPDLEALRPDAPIALVDMIYRMLEKDRNERINSVRLIGAELEAILNTGNLPKKVDQEFSTPTPGDSLKTISFSMPPSTSTKTPHNLPSQTTPFVGREEELLELRKLLGDPAIRLVSVTGPGGIGKTRLAIEVARFQLKNYADGAYFVSLAPLSAPEFIVPAIAEAIKFTFYGGGTPKDQLLDYLREKAMLLVMDNFEHLVAAANLVDEILQTSADVKILVTSRERLNLQQEHLFRVEGMDFPDWETPEDAAEYSAVKLFLQSARRVQPGFVLKQEDLRYVARICRLVEGLPLGILLAAAWVEMLSLKEIATEIERSLDFLVTDTRNLPERQRSVRAVFDYSWNLLNDDERAIFRRLSIFRGGFTREAAQQVTDASLRALMTLVNKSLLRRDQSGRYEIHELLRQYAERRLAENTAETQAVQDRHSDYYMALLTRQEPALKGAGQRDALDTIETEIDNIRAAWNWAAEQPKVEALNRALESMWLFCHYRSRLQEAEEAFAKVMTGLKLTEPTGIGAITLSMAMCHHVHASLRNGFTDALKTQYAEALRRLAQLDAQNELAWFSLWIPGSMEERQRQIEASLKTFEKTNDAWGMAMAQGVLGRLFVEYGFHAQAKPHLQISLDLYTAMGNPLSQALGGFDMGWCLYQLANYQEAHQYVEMVLPVFREFGAPNFLILGLRNMGNILANLDHFDEARRSYEESLDLARTLGNRTGIIFGLTDWGLILWHSGRTAEAHKMLQQALTLAKQFGQPVAIGNAYNNLGHPTLTLGHYQEAEGYYLEALHLLVEGQHIPFIVESLGGLGVVRGKMGDYERAVEWLTFARQHPQRPAELDRMLDRFIDELKTQLPSETFEAAQARAQELDLEATINEILSQPH